MRGKDLRLLDVTLGVGNALLPLLKRLLELRNMVKR